MLSIVHLGCSIDRLPVLTRVRDVRVGDAASTRDPHVLETKLGSTEDHLPDVAHTVADELGLLINIPVTVACMLESGHDGFA
jgi:hypothetical protein